MPNSYSERLQKSFLLKKLPDLYLQVMFARSFLANTTDCCFKMQYFAVLFTQIITSFVHILRRLWGAKMVEDLRGFIDLPIAQAYSTIFVSYLVD